MSRECRRCPYCTHPMQPISRRQRKAGKPLHRNHETRQHILPKRRGGTSEPENLKPCCHDCNQALEVVGDCPGALACMRWLGKGLYGVASNETARYAAFKVGLRWQWLEVRP